jgi:hypothetical protein
MHGREGSAMEQQGCCWCSAVHSGENPPHPHYFVFYLERRRRTALHYITNEKKREEIHESTRENSTHPDTRQHTQPSTHTNHPQKVPKR